MSEFEQFRCMISSEDTKDGGPAYCAYPKCWLGECPHKQARDCLAESALREQSLMLQLGERDNRLAEAEETIKSLEWGKFEAENESSMKNDKIAELKSRLRAVSELTKKLKEYVEWDRPQVTHSFYASQLRGVIGELEVVLGEAEG